MAGHGGKRQGAGRRPGPQRDELREILDEAVPREHRVAIIEVLAARARAGDPKAAGLLLDRLYGRVVDEHAVVLERTVQALREAIERASPEAKQEIAKALARVAGR